MPQISNKYHLDFFIADSFNIESLDKVTLKTKLVISTVGPYSLYGKKLVQSCVNNRCHYLDLTGEPEFVHFV